jgi:hypothetical protein
LVSENIIYLLVARYTSIDIINQRDAITALEDEVGRWVLK